MKVYYINQPTFLIYEIVKDKNTGYQELISSVCNVKDVRYPKKCGMLDWMDQWLIDVKEKENAQELYILNIEESQMMYNPHTFEPETNMYIRYYAHDKITNHNEKIR